MITCAKTRGDTMSVKLGCQITFRPDSPVIPPLALLEAMCAMRIRKAARPVASNDNLKRAHENEIAACCGQR